MTLGLTFLSLMATYWWKNYILNFKKLISLTLTDTLKRNPKVISNHNFFSRFQSWCCFWCWSWCLHFVQKNKTIWLVLKILGLQGFSLQPVWISAPLSVRKWPNLSWPAPPSPPFLTKFLNSPNFYILLLEVGD